MMKMMTPKSIWSCALMQAVGVTAYVAVVVAFMNNAQNIFGKGNGYMTGLVVLMLFVMSAAIVGSLTIAKPLMMYIDGQKKEAIKLFSLTIAWLFVIFVLILSGYLLGKNI